MTAVELGSILPAVWHKDADHYKHLLHNVAANAGAPITLNRGSTHEYACQSIHGDAQSYAVHR